ncbi:MAG: hypothetical protein Q4G69_10825 [Planctomycetia bacterium]|nr:hypothetical protein [Planctomycetia bacterium]
MPFLRKLKKRDQQFLIRQGSRRLQLHILLGLAGISMLFGIWLPAKAFPACWAAAWFIAILTLCWAVLLACVDFISIKLFYLGEERQDRIDQIQKDYELRAILRKELEKQALDESEPDQNKNDQNQDSDQK